MWITNGGFADVYVVFAKIDGDKFSCFIVERGYPGFSVGAEEKKMGIKGSSTVPIFFENCPVPKENLLHEVGRGHIVAFNTLNVGRFSLGAYCLGGSKKVLEASSKYSKERTAFGKQLREFGLIRGKLGEMAIRIFAVESMIYRSAGMLDAALCVSSSPERTRSQQAMQVLEEYAIESSISKIYGSETLDFCVDEGVQIFGGYGFHEDYPVARAYRDSRINRIFEGTNEINRMLIMQMLMKRAMGGVLPLIPAAMKLTEEVMSGPSLEEAPDRRIGGGRARAGPGQKDFFAGRGNRRTEIPRQSWPRSRKSSLRFRQRGDGNLRHGIRPASHAKSRGRARRSFHRRNGRCHARFHLWRWRSRRERSANSAGRDTRRRYAAHATCRAQALLKAQNRSMSLRCGGASPMQFSRRIAIPSKAASAIAHSDETGFI